MSPYTCMSEDELALWMMRLTPTVRSGGQTPCVDCPAFYRTAMVAEGRCVKALRIPRVRPARRVAPSLPDVALIGRGKRPGYPTEEARIAARRQSWRKCARRRRAAAALATHPRARDNDAAEYSGPIAHTVQRPAVRLYSERQGVGIPGVQTG